MKCLSLGLPAIMSLVRYGTGQDISDEAQSAVSQSEGATSIFPFCFVQRRLSSSVTGSGEESDASGINVDQSRTNDDFNHTISDKPIEAETQIRACFLTIL